MAKFLAKNHDAEHNAHATDNLYQMFTWMLWKLPNYTPSGKNYDANLSIPDSIFEIFEENFPILLSEIRSGNVDVITCQSKIKKHIIVRFYIKGSTSHDIENGVRRLLKQLKSWDVTYIKKNAYTITNDNEIVQCVLAEQLSQ
jgi:hypothetical protein